MIINSEEPILHIIYCHYRKEKYLLIIFSSRIIVINLNLEKVLGFMNIKQKRLNPIVWHDTEFLYIMGGKGNKTNFDKTLKINLF